MVDFMSHVAVPIAIGAVAVVLLLGLINMMRGGSGNNIAKTHAASRAAAIHRHRCYHVDGLDHGEITDKERGLFVLNEIYTRTGDDSTTCAWHRQAAQYALRIATQRSTRSMLGMCADRVILR